MLIMHALVTIAVLSLVGAASPLHAFAPDRLTEAEAESRGLSVEQSEISYDDFMRLDRSDQRSRFQTLTAENKASLKRTHAERWVAVHEGELTPGQRRVTTAVIEYLTPERYTEVPDAQGRAAERELVARLRCAVGAEAVREMLTFAPRELRPSASLRDRLEPVLDEWLFWFTECVL